MSSPQQIISKGYYAHWQIDGFVSVKNYIFSYRDDRKYLLIRFSNLSDFVVHSMEFTLSLLDRSGTVLEERKILLKDLTFAPGHTYSPTQAFEVDEFCADFKVEFSRVISGKYIYRVDGQNITVLYDQETDLPPALAQPKATIWEHTVRPLKNGRQRLSVLCGVCALLLLLGLTLGKMYIRYQDALEEREAENTKTTAPLSPGK